jgi:uncharacterized protein with ParB-like and HNH nuclease domain
MPVCVRRILNKDNETLMGGYLAARDAVNILVSLFKNIYTRCFSHWLASEAVYLV